MQLSIEIDFEHSVSGIKKSLADLINFSFELMPERDPKTLLGRLKLKVEEGFGNGLSKSPFGILYAKTGEGSNRQGLCYFTFLATLSSKLIQNIQNGNGNGYITEHIFFQGYIIPAIVAAIDAKDPYTQRHSLNVANLSCDIGSSLGLTEKELSLLRSGALLHDLGKMAIPDSILAKPDKLTDFEWCIVKQHPTIGKDILSNTGYCQSVTSLIPIIYQHHERPDGRGYPTAISDIDLLARITAIADSYDAMTSDRPYRKGMSKERTLNEISKNRGTQFDERCVDALLAKLEKDKSFD